jgi:hypothetical protein
MLVESTWDSTSPVRQWALNSDKGLKLEQLIFSITLFYNYVNLKLPYKCLLRYASSSMPSSDPKA